MLSHEIARREAKGRPAPLLDDQRNKWLHDLFDGLGDHWSDMARNHERHGNTVKALLQLACALHTSDEGDRRSSLETARAFIDDALAGKPPKHHLQDAAEAVRLTVDEIIAGRVAP